MTRLKWVLTIAIGAVVIAGAAASLMLSQSPQAQRFGAGRVRGGAQGPVPVLAIEVKRADVPVYLDGIGTTKALNTVTVRSQVDGKLIGVDFKEGQDVAKGHVLARIDPTTYQAQYDQALAKKAQDEAQLANARIDLERYRKLAQTNSGPRQQADTQAAAVAQLEAQIKSDQAAIENAKAFLDYTRIVAPISGRTGIRLIDEGNIVRAADATGIVVITQIKPISIIFTLPQQQLSQVNKAFAQGQLQVEAMASDNKSVSDRGVLQVIDNQVDQTTGTVKLKAEFPNGDLQLWPGQFINVRLLVDTLRQVLVAPTAAIQRGPNGPFVYVIRPGDVVAVRAVVVSQQTETQAVIESGLQAEERVVTTGFARLTDGAAITVSNPSGGGQSPVGTPAERRQRRNDGAGPEAGRPERGEGRRGQRSDATQGRSQ